jgi:hypothetical protein
MRDMPTQERAQKHNSSSKTQLLIKLLRARETFNDLLLFIIFDIHSSI